MLASQITKLHSDYLWGLTHLCHVSPTENLRVTHLFRLVIEIDEYVEAQKEANS